MKVFILTVIFIIIIGFLCSLIAYDTTFACAKLQKEVKARTKEYFRSMQIILEKNEISYDVNDFNYTRSRGKGKKQNSHLRTKYLNPKSEISDVDYYEIDKCIRKTLSLNKGKVAYVYIFIIGPMGGGLRATDSAYVTADDFERGAFTRTPREELIKKMKL